MKRTDPICSIEEKGERIIGHERGAMVKTRGISPDNRPEWNVPRSPV